MRLEIRDLESSMVYDISADGAVMGRERAKTDISFRDESISKRHARIYHDGGSWFLEDLGSSNGTYLDDQRVNGPVMLSQGAIFSLAQKRFEVVYADNGNGAGALIDDFPPLGVPSARSGGELPPPAGESMDNRFEPSDSDGDEVEAKDFSYFFVAVPKAIAYYMIAVPLMAVNPLGTIRKGIEEQKLPAMGKMELIAYAIPSFVFSSLIGSLVAAIVTMIAAGFGAGIMALLTAWVGPLIAIVVAAIVGFLWHPVMGWLIQFLKGESNAKSRTNYAVMSWTLAILFVIPSNIGALIGLIPLPFVGVIPAALGVVVAGINFVFFTKWLRFFGVYKWLQTVVMVLLGLGILGSAWGVVSAILNPGSIGGGTVAMNTSGMTEEQKAATEPAQKMAEEAGANGNAADLQAKAAELAAKVAQNRDPKAVEDAKKAAEEAANTTAKIDTKAEADTKADQEEVAAKTEKSEKAEKADEKASDPPPPISVNLSVEPKDDPVVKGKLNTEFAQFLWKRAAIEEAIEKNPKLVDDEKIKDDYEELWKKTFEIRDKWAKKKGESWKKTKVINRQKDQEVFVKTRGHVDKVYRAIFAQ